VPEHRKVRFKHLILARTTSVRIPKWIVVVKTEPIDPDSAREEARWLKLGDDALSNQSSQELGNGRDMTLGIRALRKLEQATQNLEQALNKYRLDDKHSS
jgi:hypothetical protein